MRTAFVGRERELAMLVSGLDDAAAGRATVVICQGEPGIGKSRLVEEFARCAVDRGALVVWGRAADSAGAPPFWPSRQVLRLLSEGLGDVAAASGRLTSDASADRTLSEQRRLGPSHPTPCTGVRRASSVGGDAMRPHELR